MVTNKNVGLADRIIRIILGVILIYVGWVVWENNTAGIVIDVVGVILIITGIIGYCSIYKIFKINTCKQCQAPTDHKKT